MPVLQLHGNTPKASEILGLLEEATTAAEIDATVEQYGLTVGWPSYGSAGHQQILRNHIPVEYGLEDGDYPIAWYEDES